MDTWLEYFAETAFRRSADTAHDLKTPLNVAVLNLELLRMRLAKLIEQPDAKVTAYASAVELELRRMARIFDAFFLLSAPPKGEQEPGLVDAAQFAPDAEGSAMVRGHEARIREAYKMFFDGASRLLKEDRTTTARRADGHFEVTVTGNPQASDFELTKIFKFYYSGPDGMPDLSLATARLVAETYGGGLLAGEEHDKVWLRLTFPLGDK